MPGLAGPEVGQPLVVPSLDRTVGSAGSSSAPRRSAQGVPAVPAPGAWCSTVRTMAASP